MSRLDTHRRLCGCITVWDDVEDIWLVVDARCEAHFTGAIVDDDPGPDSDPLRDALVALFEAIAEREGKLVPQVVEEFFSGYVTGGVDGIS